MLQTYNRWSKACFPSRFHVLTRSIRATIALSIVDRLLIVVHQAFNAIKQTFLAQVNQIYWPSHGFHEPGLTGSESFIVTLACGQ